MSVVEESNKIYILTPVYNRIKTTADFVDCLIKQTHKNFQLVLIDDGSSDGTSSMVTEKLTNTKVIRGGGNWWWAGSLQQGCKWLRSRKINPDDVVLILNDDTSFDERFLEHGINLLKENSNALLISECYFSETKEIFDRGVVFDDKNFTFRPSEDNSETNCASTRGLFVNAADFINLGGFHPILLPHYGSDYEFTVRASKKGYRIFSTPEVKVWTSGAMSGIEELERELHGRNFWGAVRTLLFSKRCRRNVVYLSVLAIMTCRWYCIPGIVYQIWLREARGLFRILPGPVYGMIRLVLVPVYVLVKEIVVYIKVVASETMNSLRLIFGQNTSLK